MEQRKVSFEENRKMKQAQNKIVIPTPKKHTNLVKPDFSPIFEKQNKFGYKTFGSYKKPKYKEPESPMKSPNFKTSVKMKGVNLFGPQSQENNGEFDFFKKLNFDEVADEKNNFLGRKNVGINFNKENKEEKNRFNMLLEKCEEEDEDDYFNLGIDNYHKSTQNTGIEIEEEKEEKINSINLTEKENYKYKKKGGLRKCSINIENNIDILKTGKFEGEFNQLKTIKTDKFSTIYKVKKIISKEIFCIKKIVKTSPKSNIDNLKKITYDFKNNITNKLSQFCVQNIEYWIEKEEFKQFSELNFCNKNLYLLTNYYENGDIFDFLEKLEKIKFKFTEEFYWDLIFEMIMGVLFVHECGYIHIDIQPGNFLVNAEGYIKLNDFSLAIKKIDLPNLDDIIEGDSRYISKELFHFDKNNAKKINEKTDIFSLGLTLLELIAKIELPYNGELWHKLRDENFKISESFFDKCNIENHKEFMILISQMILPFEKRPNLREIINYFSELKKRYEKLFSGRYSKSCELPRFDDGISNKILNLRSAPSTDIL